MFIALMFLRGGAGGSSTPANAVTAGGVLVTASAITVTATP